MNDSYPIPIRIEVSRQRIADIMITALEGYTTDWCRVVPCKLTANYERPWYADPSYYGGEDHALFIVRPEDEEEPVTVTLEDLLKVFTKESRFALEDTAHIDAEDADRFLQLAAFGEVVYG